MATPKEQFIHLLKQDIEQYETHAKRIDELLPHISSDLRDHWKNKAAIRRAYADELRLLLQRAEADGN